MPVMNRPVTATSTKENKYRNPFDYDYVITNKVDLPELRNTVKAREAATAERIRSKRVDQYKCKLCGKRFPKEDLLQHYELHKKIADQSSEISNEADVMFKCPVCPREFTSRSGYDCHVKSMHQTKDFACKTCKECFQDEYQLNLHVAKHSGNPSLFTCIKCKQFSTKDQSQLISHINNVHYSNISQQFYCKECDRYFKSRGWFDSHKIFHLKNNSKLFCDFCKIFLLDSMDFNSHMTTVHNIELTKVFKCEKCDLTFPNYKSLQLHNKKIHQPCTSLLCNVCGKAFAKACNMISHMKIHEERKFICQTCGKRFATSRGLAVHTLIHTGEKPHKCDVCSKSFSQRSTLIIHLRTHTGERPYPCDKCKKGFITKTIRDAHQRTCR